MITREICKIQPRNMIFSDFIATKVNEKLGKVLVAIKNCSILIENKISRASFENSLGAIDHVNASGDVQKKLDVIANDIMIHALTETNCCSVLLSEENDEPIALDDDFNKDKYIIAFDPLDGSSNIDCNCSIGTIFSIYDDAHNGYLIKGDNIVCAGYVLYGPVTEFVLTYGNNNGVHKFTLDKKLEDYVCTGTMRIPANGKKIYSINESNFENWSDDMKQYISQYKVKNTKYTQRYIGSMVADVHRTLLYGGVFCYPADNTNKNGKLRLMYECGPMAKIIEEAGGKSIVGNKSIERILNIVPTDIHQKTPIIMGSTIEVEKYKP